MFKRADEVDLFLDSLLNQDNTEQNLAGTAISIEKYQLPIRVGIKNMPLNKGDTPWVVGHFAPGKYLNDTHPQGHDGVDLKAPAGTPIYPVASGIVIETGQYPKGGITCKISHENGQVISYYAHLNQLKVQINQEVTQKTEIGIIGQTGNAKGRGEHLHYEIKVMGQKVDPMKIVGQAVGTLSQKKNAEWSDVLNNFIKNSGIINIPEDLYLKVSKYVLSYWANLHLNFINDKLFLNTNYKNKLIEFIDIIRDSNYYINPTKLEEAIHNRFFDLNKEFKILDIGYAVIHLKWDIKPLPKHKYDVHLLFKAFDKKYFFEYKNKNIDSMELSEKFLDLFEVCEHFYQDMEITETVDLISYKLLEKYLRIFKPNPGAVLDSKKFEIDSNNVLYVIITHEESNSVGKYHPSYWDISENKFIHIIDIFINKPKNKQLYLQEEAKEEVQEITQTIRHELRHLLQDKMKHDLNLNNLPGLSGKKERSRIYNKDGVPKDKYEEMKYLSEEDFDKVLQSHPLRDIEFYTRLSDSISQFKNEYNKYSDEIKDIAARVWCGIINKPPPRKDFPSLERNDFFIKLRDNYHKRWRKAVKEFWKSVFQDELTLKDFAFFDAKISKFAGIIKVPQNLEKQISEFIINQYSLMINQGAELALDFNRNELSEKDIKNLQNIYHTSKEYIHQFSDSKMKTFDFNGKKINVLLRKGNKNMDRAIYSYNPLKNNEDYLIITFFMPETSESFLYEIEKLKIAINHELQHVIQYNHVNDFGLPKKKLRNNLDIDFKPDDETNNKDYYIDDYEFYPLLKSSIDMFNLAVNKFPKEKRQQLMQDWVGAGNNELIPTEDFFEEIKEKEPEKWKKAVKEFYKNVNLSNNDNIIEKSAGLVRMPEYIIKEICNYVWSKFAKHVMENFPNNIGDVEKYLFLKYLRSIIDLEQGSSEIQKKFTYGKEIIDVFLSYDLNQSTGQYRKSNMVRHHHLIDIGLKKPIFKNLDDFKKELLNLKRIVEHEFIHVQQEYYKNQYKINDLYGLPSIKIREKDKTPDGFSKYDRNGINLNNRAIHEFRDVEFYTWLNDEKRRFEQSYGNLPEALKEEAARAWVGLPKRLKGDLANKLESSIWFLMLMRSREEKWRKAVKEFWKTIFDDDIKV